jgi:threonine dehydratase
VFVGLQVRDSKETRQIVRRLRRRGLKTLDFSDNELAKLHIRHTVGGHAPAVDNEILYRFEFPERPGALMKFLEAMSSGWNITLFHYRNHGADYGRVLIGMQVPPRDKRKFRAFLARVGYPCQEESRNPAYRLFLA